jgi:hypothetical protein
MYSQAQRTQPLYLGYPSSQSVASILNELSESFRCLVALLTVCSGGTLGRLNTRLDHTAVMASTALGNAIIPWHFGAVFWNLQSGSHTTPTSVTSNQKHHPQCRTSAECGGDWHRVISGCQASMWGLQSAELACSVPVHSTLPRLRMLDHYTHSLISTTR